MKNYKYFILKFFFNINIKIYNIKIKRLVFKFYNKTSFKNFHLYN